MTDTRMDAIHADKSTPGPRREITAWDTSDGHIIRVTFPACWGPEEVTALLPANYAALLPQNDSPEVEL